MSNGIFLNFTAPNRALFPQEVFLDWTRSFILIPSIREGLIFEVGDTAADYVVIDPSVPVLPPDLINNDIVQDRSELQFTPSSQRLCSVEYDRNLFDLSAETQPQDTVSVSDDSSSDGERNVFTVRTRSNKFKV